MTSCSPLKVSRRFEGKYRLHLQAVCYPLHGSFLGGLSFDLKAAGDVNPKRRLTFNGQLFLT
jgi:hypothetical protein